jgi:hypothetical protein
MQKNSFKCEKCNSNHRLSSKVGQKHQKYKYISDESYDFELDSNQDNLSIFTACRIYHIDDFDKENLEDLLEMKNLHDMYNFSNIYIWIENEIDVYIDFWIAIEKGMNHKREISKAFKLFSEMELINF